MGYKNKEDEKAYRRKHYLDNKEKVLAQNKAWKMANKDKVSEQHKAQYNSTKDGLYTVYLLPKEGYVGMTTNLHKRIIYHKNNNNIDTTDVQILGKYHTKDEAKRIEDGFHNNGFKGAYGFKQRMEEFNKPEAIARRKEIEQELLLIGNKFNLI